MKESGDMLVSKERDRNAKCEVCRSMNWKYKCSVCRLRHCSLSCYKQHKESGCCTPVVVKPVADIKDTTQKDVEVVYEFETEDTVPVSKIVKLEESAGVRECLKNPHLRNLLKELDSATDPAPLLDQLMREPIFTEFADECLKVVEPNYPK